MALFRIPTDPALRADLRTTSLVGLAHGSSHFFHLLLPPMFPVFIREFGLSYTELGLLVTLFFVVSGLGQALSGFLVDRVGARPVLFAAFLSFIAAALIAASAQGPGALAVAALLAGLGNAPFHPADFTILNQRIAPQRLGHAYSAHGIFGNLGWALAPVFLVGLTGLFDSWRLAYLASALFAAVVLLVLYSQREALDDHHRARRQARAARMPQQGERLEHPMAFLRLPSVWLCFSFFFWSTAAMAAIQGFASPALQQMHGLPLSLTAFVVTGFMLCGAAGMVVGGFLVARGLPLERVISLAIGAGAAVLVAVGLGLIPGATAVAAVALSGVAIGLAGPSRDMLIKRAAPPGATGRVYGTVYSGLDIGFALGAPVFGRILDAGWPGGVFLAAALALAAGIVSAGLVGRAGQPARAAEPRLSP